MRWFWKKKLNKVLIKMEIVLLSGYVLNHEHRVKEDCVTGRWYMHNGELYFETLKNGWINEDTIVDVHGGC